MYSGSYEISFLKLSIKLINSSASSCFYYDKNRKCGSLDPYQSSASAGRRPEIIE